MSTDLHVLQLQFKLPSLLQPLLLPGTDQLGEAVLLLRQPLLPLVLPVNLPSVNQAAPGSWGAEDGGRAVAPPVVVAVAVPVVTPAAITATITTTLIVPVDFLSVIPGGGPDQRGVAHTPDDVLHPGPLGAKVFVGQSVQVEGREGERL